MSTTILTPPRPAPQEQESAADNPRATMGHNRLPVEEQAVGDFNDGIDKIDGLRARLKELVDSASRAKAGNDHEAGLCATLIKQIDTAIKAAEGVRVDVKAPYLEAGRRVDAAAKTLTDSARTAMSNVRGIAEAYLRKKAAEEAAERRRLEEEERRKRERLEAEARAEIAAAQAEERDVDHRILEAPVLAAAAPKAVEPTRVRSDLGQVASARTKKVAVITDWAKAFKSVKNVKGVQEAVQTAINALVRAGQTEIAGVEIKDDIALTVR